MYFLHTYEANGIDSIGGVTWKYFDFVGGDGNGVNIFSDCTYIERCKHKKDSVISDVCIQVYVWKL